MLPWSEQTTLDKVYQCPLEPSLDSAVIIYQFRIGVAAVCAEAA